MMANHHDEYKAWPCVTQEEFELACHFFDQRYVSAKLGAVRKAFKLRLRRTMTSGETYIEILRLLQPPEDEDELSAAFAKLGTSDEVDLGHSNEVVMMAEDADKDALHVYKGNGQEELPGYSLHATQPYVKYEIHLHSTYAVPTLWFSLHDLPLGDNAFDLDSVYRYLVPDAYKNHLRGAGIIGGISAAPHPITDVPAFFIHPCQTTDALRAFDCPLKTYLMVWLGLVGSCVGLWIPPEMSMNQDS